MRWPDSGTATSFAAFGRWAWSFTGRRGRLARIWFIPALNRYTTLPNHPGDMPEGTLRAILRQAGVEAQVFFAGK